MFRATVRAVLITLASLYSIGRAAQPPYIVLDPNGVSKVYPPFDTAGWTLTQGAGSLGDHDGDDYYAEDWAHGCDSDGKHLFAAISGIAVVVYNDPSYGNTLVVYDADSQFAVRYAHMQEIDINIITGSFITAGQYVGKVGHTGNVRSATCPTGAHLHIALYKLVSSAQARPIVGTVWLINGPTQTTAAPSQYAAPVSFIPQQNLIKDSSSSAVYALTNNMVRSFVTAFVLVNQGWSFTDNTTYFNPIAILPDDQVSLLPLRGTYWPPRDGTLIKGDLDPTVYIIKDGLKTTVSADVFSCWGFQVADINTISQDELNHYPPLTNPTALTGCPVLLAGTDQQFSLTAVPNSVLVLQGTSMQVSITPTFASGFAGPLSNFSVLGLPSGISASFNPTFANGSGNSITLTLQATTTTPTGVFHTYVTAGTFDQTGVVANLDIIVSTPFARGHVNVGATLNGQPWSGPLSYFLGNNPNIQNGSHEGSAVPLAAYLPVGTFTIMNIQGGPGSLTSITPSATQALYAGGPDITFWLNFSSAPTFTITPSNTAVTMPAGRYGGLPAVSLAYANMPNGSSVTQVFQNLPPGVSVFPVSQALSGSGTATVNTIINVLANTAPGAYSVTVYVTAAGVTKTYGLTLTITAPPAGSCTVMPNPGFLGAGETVSVATVGGIPPIHFTINGMNLGSANSSVVMPMQIGTYTATFVAMDSVGGTVSGSCSAQIKMPTPSISGYSLGSAPKHGTNFNMSVTGENFASGAAVYFYGPGCANGCQQPPAGVVVNNAAPVSNAISVVNIQLAAGMFYFRVMNPGGYWSAPSTSFSVK